MTINRRKKEKNDGSIIMMSLNRYLLILRNYVEWSKNKNSHEVLWNNRSLFNIYPITYLYKMYYNIIEVNKIT